MGAERGDAGTHPSTNRGPDAGRRLALVEEHVRAENRHDLDGILATFGPEARYDDEPWDDHRRGREEVRAYYEALLTAAPDLRIDVLSRHVTAEVVILEVRITGTHLGPFRGLPPTGREMDFPLCAVYDFDDRDRLAGERIYYDRATVLRQLGVLHDPATPRGRLATLVGHPLTLGRAWLRQML